VRRAVDAPHRRANILQLVDTMQFLFAQLNKIQNKDGILDDKRRAVVR
jgi:hypothetical protein